MGAPISNNVDFLTLDLGGRSNVHLPFSSFLNGQWTWKTNKLSWRKIGASGAFQWINNFLVTVSHTFITLLKEDWFGIILCRMIITGFNFPNNCFSSLCLIIFHGIILWGSLTLATADTGLILCLVDIHQILLLFLSFMIHFPFDHLVPLWPLWPFLLVLFLFPVFVSILHFFVGNV